MNILEKFFNNDSVVIGLCGIRKDENSWSNRKNLMKAMDSRILLKSYTSNNSYKVNYEENILL